MDTSAYFRIHIRANSDCEEEQAVKYLVRDKVVEYLLPVVAGTNSKDEAKACVEKNLKNIEEVANSVLEKNGFSYKSHAEVKKEEFPTRVYEEVTLPEGVYDALILELGTGSGKNWWCVVYPPLCFSQNISGKVVYKSWIVEKIKEWKAER